MVLDGAQSGPVSGGNSGGHFRLLDLPREIIRTICQRIYDPIELTQEDRLTWGIFSTVDMHQERQDDLASLVALGSTCRKIRKEVRVLLFRCIRTPTLSHVEEVLRNADGWARYVKSVIVDLSMFDSEEGESRTSPNPSIDPHHSLPHRRQLRSCWRESAQLVQLVTALPALEHISFFADASDDSTLSLFFSSLITHPSLHRTPPSTVPPSPSALSSTPGPFPHIPFAHRLSSFGWRQRAAPPTGFRQFSQSTTFVSTLHLLRHAYKLSFLVLDADLDEMDQEDILVAVKELSLRDAPVGEKAEKVSLMLCGPIRGWEDNFLQDLVDTFKDIKELFIDRPLKKQKEAHATSFEAFISLLHPLTALLHLRLLQVGSYLFPPSVQTLIALSLARSIPSLLVVGLLGQEGETIWWGIVRRASTRPASFWATPRTRRPSFVALSSLPGVEDKEVDLRLMPLGDGYLRMLEDDQLQWGKSREPEAVEDVKMTPPTQPVEGQSSMRAMALENILV